MGVILLLADAQEPWSLHVERELLKRHHPVRRIEPAALLDNLLIDWRLSGFPSALGAAVSTCGLGHECPVELDGVLVGMSPASLQFPHNSFPPEDQAYVTMEWMAGLYAWLRSLSCPVINVPVPGRGAVLLPSHPMIREACRRAGWMAAPHAVVTDRMRAAQWFDRWNRHVRVQSCADGSVMGELRGTESLPVMEELLLAGPVVIQPIPEGVRSHAILVGSTVIGGTCRTAVQDSRLCSGVLDATTVSPQVAHRCRQLVQSLGLTCAEIAFVHRPDDSLHCLGVSERPAFGRCSDALRQSVVGHLVNVLDHTQEWRTRDSALRTHGRSHDCQPSRPSCCAIG